MKNDAFRAGVDRGGLFSTDAIKIMICCIFDQSDIPLSFENVNNILLSEELANYFDVQQALSQLVKDEIILDNGQKEFTLSEKGRFIAKELSSSLSFIVKQTATAATKKEIVMARKLKDNSVDIRMGERSDDYIVDISMREQNSEFMHFSFHVGTLDMANEIKKNFLNEPRELYFKTIELLLGYERNND